MNHRVVITGLGCITAGAKSVRDLLKLLNSGKSAITRINSFKTNNFRCQIGAVPDNAFPDFIDLMNLYKLKYAGDVTKMIVFSGFEAWKDAGLHIPDIDSIDVDFETGCIIGSVNGNIELYTRDIVEKIHSDKPKKLRSTIVEQVSFSAPSSTLAGILAIGNLVMSNSSACSSSTDSIIQCYERIKTGKATRMIAGGAEGFSLNTWAAAESIGYLTIGYNNNPQKASCPFCKNASGAVLGSGAGIIILESLESAITRGANIYAEILGGVSNCGGQRNGGSMSTPNPIALKKCFEDTLYYTAVKASDIDLISGHLNSTNVDLIEIDLWKKALKRKGNDFPFINAIKSYIGYNMGAEGVLDTIAAALELKNQLIFPNLNSRPVNENILRLIDEERIPDKLIENYPLNYIIKGSFGFGDVNSCIVLKKFVE